MDRISVLIPTLNRPACLQRALASVAAQEGLEGFELDVVVVDNSPDGSSLSRMAPMWPSVRFLHEPRPGVANARNAGVAAARGRWIAFLDDDEEASPRWIASLLAAAKSSGADAIFGPIEGRAEGEAEIGGFFPYFSRAIEAPDGADITAMSAILGTNNSMFDRERCLDGGATFDPTLNESGGEDSLLLQKLKLRGRRFAWASHARVIEWAPPRRLNWAYVRKRKFLSGQIRVFVQHMASPGRWDVVAGWMAVGLAQFLISGAAALALKPFAPDRAAKAEAAAYGGLGKVFWQRGFRPALYGMGLVS